MGIGEAPLQGVALHGPATAPTFVAFSTTTCGFIPRPVTLSGVRFGCGMPP